MIRWAVTGPAGGGKSTFCQLLAVRGASVVDGDHLGHEILAWTEIIGDISREFGNEVVVDGQVDRGLLGQKVFGDASALERLNLITLAPIGQLAAARLDLLTAEGRYRLAVLEAAVYFLLPPVPGVNLVITVTADPEIRIARMMETGALDRRLAEARVVSQRPMEKAWTGADVIVENGGSVAELEKSANELWSQLDT